MQQLPPAAPPVLLKKYVSEVGFRILFDPLKDGRCQFSAVAHQLDISGIVPGLQPGWIRKFVTEYLNKNSSAFEGFVCHASHGAKNDVTCWKKYVEDMSKEYTFGDHITVLAMATIFNVQIVILSTLGINATHVVTPLTAQIDSTNGECIDLKLPLLFVAHGAEQHQQHYVSVIPLHLSALRNCFVRLGASISDTDMQVLSTACFN